MLGLVGELGEERLAVVVAIPFREIFDFAEGGVRDLHREETEEGCAGGVVVLGVGADEVEGGKGVDVVAVGRLGIFRMILESGFVRVVLVTNIRLHRIWL